MQYSFVCKLSFRNWKHKTWAQLYVWNCYIFWMSWLTNDFYACDIIWLSDFWDLYWCLNLFPPISFRDLKRIWPTGWTTTDPMTRVASITMMKTLPWGPAAPAHTGTGQTSTMTTTKTPKTWPLWFTTQWCQLASSSVACTPFVLSFVNGNNRKKSREKVNFNSSHK